MSKFPDDFNFPRVHCFHVGARSGNFKAEAFGVLGLVEYFRGVNESFRGHAAPQNAEPAKLWGAINDGHLQAEPSRYAGGIKAGTAATNADKVVCFQGEEPGAARVAAPRFTNILILGCRAIRRFIPVTALVS